MTPAVFDSEQILRRRLIDFIEASDPIRDLQTQRERRRLLEEPGAISTVPALEIAPSYTTGPNIRDIGLPSDFASILTDYANLEVGIYDPPYLHQANAYRSILRDDRDVLVTSGTGSGKTETFLYPILARLAREAQRDSERFGQPGMRALILYPMNALVSDQIARLRRLFGNPAVQESFIRSAGIPARFGMYTGRTPYPGLPSSSRNKNELESILRYYLDLEDNDAVLLDALRSLGRVPVKNLQALQDAIGQGEKQLATQPQDVELLTRHEMQAWCPHILVTNYSMLEYMLMRPIERRIFEQTCKLYQQDSTRRLLIVLDEAHLYRGVSGGEVSFLLRRLLARLELDRDRVQFILTSASMGTDEAARDAAKRFVVDLVGQPSSLRQPLEIIQGELVRPTPVDGVADVDGESFLRVANALIEVLDNGGLDDDLLVHLRDLGILVDSDEESSFSERLGRALDRWPLLSHLRTILRDGTSSIDALGAHLFPDMAPDRAHEAARSLLDVASRATLNGRALLPMRLHMFFRGIPAIYACINPRCSAVEADSDSEGLGKLYFSPRLHCDCGARTYELLIHRDCGARLLRVYATDDRGDFFWHEGGRPLRGREVLTPTHLLIEFPHRTALSKCDALYVNIWTGRAQAYLPDPIDSQWRRFYRPKRRELKKHQKSRSSARYVPLASESELSESTFSDCPACGKRNGGRQIRSLGSTGERPFATLVREQLFLQPPTEQRSDRHPNEGRKSLIFSDGRQRAARLARDLPREIEKDGFRQALLLAARRLEDCGFEPKFDRPLYTAFLSVCSDFYLSFFDQEGGEQRRLSEDIANYRNHRAQLEEVLEEDDLPDPSARFRLAVYRQLCDPYFSLWKVNVGRVGPSKNRLRRLRTNLAIARLEEEFPNDWQMVIERWIRGLLEDGAFDPQIGSMHERLNVRPYLDIAESYPLADIFPASILDRISIVTSLAEVSEALEGELTRPGEQGRLLDGKGLVLQIAVDEAWWRCRSCFRFFADPFSGFCPECGEASIESCSPEHPLLAARSDYYRSDVRKVLGGNARPVNLVVEEHTAQLSHRDRGRVWATTEEYELRFQDLRVTSKAPPIDILSCTTTMEVGIDIGSLNAVGLGNFPPQRENYQQRAGRAGRRGSRLTTVVTYARNNAHDAHYFANIGAMVAGEPRRPRVDADNRRIAERHINALLIQTFFHGGAADAQLPAAHRADLFSSLGTVGEFFEDEAHPCSFEKFVHWSEEPATHQHVPRALLDGITGLDSDEERLAYVSGVRDRLNERLHRIASDFNAGLIRPHDPLLDVLFDNGLLPSYAFPTDLCSFVIQRHSGDKRPGEIEQRPQQEKVRALSEYAPGRQLVVDKRTYTVGGIFIDGVGKPDERFRAFFERSLDLIVFCPQCTFVKSESSGEALDGCPVCGAELQQRLTIDPPAFSPRAGKPEDGEGVQTYTTATQAQFPLPLEDQQLTFAPAGEHLEQAFRRDQRLVVSNTGVRDQGFLICSKCGAIEPQANAGTIGEHRVPFLGSKGSSWKCDGSTFEQPVVLSHTFSTDLLLIRGKVGFPLIEDPTSDELQDALRSLAEAFALAAAFLIDADPGELASGYRFLQRSDGLLPFDIFLYDAVSGGAGYALEAGERFDELLDHVERLLETCPGGCDRSCTRCLRHYGNLPWHDRLDRWLAQSMLRYLRFGEVPSEPRGVYAESSLQPLQHYLQLEGFESRLAGSSVGRAHVAVRIGTTEHTVRLRHSLMNGEHVQRVGKDIIVSEYVLTRDLPALASQLSSAMGV